jgi:uncharacterized protein YecT (DUF1311 family)
LSRFSATPRRLALAILFAPLPVLAGPYPNTSFMGDMARTGDAWYQRCLAVEHAKPPASDLTAKAAAGKCNPIDLYYDARAKDAPGAAEWGRVRACAAATHNETVLMMLYANGYGVRQDRALATRYACSLDQVAPAEMESRVAHLQQPTTSSKPFDYCDDITSGVSGAVCASMQEGQRKRGATARLDRFAAALPAAAKSAFARLRKAQALFAEASEGNESDMHGTGAAGFAIEARGRINAEFVHDVGAVAARRAPSYGASDFARLDTELNQAYRHIMELRSKQDGSPERIGDSTMTRDGVRTTQRAWLRFRDAWAEFLIAAGSPLDPVSFKALLTERRTKQLAGIAGYY